MSYFYGEGRMKRMFLDSSFLLVHFAHRNYLLAIILKYGQDDTARNSYKDKSYTTFENQFSTLKISSARIMSINCLRYFI